MQFPTAYREEHVIVVALLGQYKGSTALGKLTTIKLEKGLKKNLTAAPLTLCPIFRLEG